MSDYGSAKSSSSVSSSSGELLTCANYLEIMDGKPFYLTLEIPGCFIIETPVTATNIGDGTLRLRADQSDITHIDAGCEEPINRVYVITFTLFCSGGELRYQVSAQLGNGVYLYVATYSQSGLPLPEQTTPISMSLSVPHTGGLLPPRNLCNGGLIESSPCYIQPALLHITG